MCPSGRTSTAPVDSIPYRASKSTLSGTRSSPITQPRIPSASAAARQAVLIRSDGHCENPHCTGQPADTTDQGDPILEIDHIHELALGGPDIPEQMIALCPNCHAIKTRGRTRNDLRTVLLAVTHARHAACLASS